MTIALFTEKKIEELIAKHNWELIRSKFLAGGYILRQKDKHYMTTNSFNLPENVAVKYLVEG